MFNLVLRKLVLNFALNCVKTYKILQNKLNMKFSSNKKLNMKF